MSSLQITKVLKRRVVGTFNGKTCIVNRYGVIQLVGTEDIFGNIPPRWITMESLPFRESDKLMEELEAKGATYERVGKSWEKVYDFSKVAVTPEEVRP